MSYFLYCFLEEEQSILDKLTAENKVEKLQKLMITQKEALKEFDKNIVMQLDEKVNYILFTISLI